MKTGLINPDLKTLEVTKAVFKSKIDRFHVLEMKKPDPGRYELRGAFSPNALIQNIPLASYRSGVKREVVFPMDLNVPGIGVYSPEDYKSIGIQKIQGGAPNNFSLLAKKSGVDALNGGISQDRAIYADTSSKIYI
jgi:hypothetical protein